MKFGLDDEVTICPPKGREYSFVLRERKGQTGTVADIDSRYFLPYEVMFPDGRRYMFAEDELMPASTEPSTEEEGIDHPGHYTWMPGGMEVIEITRHFSFVRGNALKYLMRAGRKGDELEDLKKARWYLDYEIESLKVAD
nr:DUF3310 domain-containing protein [Streptomyces sp. SID5468]